MNENLKNKIPLKTRESIKRAGDKNYNFNYDNTISLSKQNLLPETKSLLSIIYTDYLCTEEEQRKWSEYDKFEIQKKEKLKLDRYNTDNLFENTKSASNTFITNEKELQVIDNKKVGFWAKFKNCIIKLFEKI